MPWWSSSFQDTLHWKEEWEAAKRFFKRHINLHICSSHTDNKHSFGIIDFQSALKCRHSLERRAEAWHGNFHFPSKGQVLQEVSSLLKIGEPEEPAGPSPEGRRKGIWLTELGKNNNNNKQRYTVADHFG